MKRSDAETICRNEGVEEGTFYFDACVYDIMESGIESYAESAKLYQEVETDAIKEEKADVMYLNQHQPQHLPHLRLHLRLLQLLLH